MNKIITTLNLLFISCVSYSQVVYPAYQRNLMSHTNSYAITGGFLSDINGSTFTAGAILKQYGEHIKPGIRLQVQIPVNDLLYFETIADSFYQRNMDYEEKFLEIGAGLGLEHKKFQLSVLYQMTDSNPVLNKNVSDCVLLKLGYKIVLWNK